MSDSDASNNTTNNTTQTEHSDADDFIEQMRFYQDKRTQDRTQVKIREMITNFVKAHGYTSADYKFVKYKLPSDEKHSIVAARVICKNGDQQEIFNFNQRLDDFFVRLDNEHERQYEDLFYRLYTQLAPTMPAPEHDYPIIASDGNLYKYDYRIKLDNRIVCIEIGEQHNLSKRMEADKLKKKYAADHGWEYYFLSVKTAKTHPLKDEFYELNTDKDHITYYNRMHEFICCLLGIDYEPHPDPTVTCLNK